MASKEEFTTDEMRGKFDQNTSGGEQVINNNASNSRLAQKRMSQEQQTWYQKPVKNIDF